MLLQNLRDHVITQCHNPEEHETIFLNSTNQTSTILTTKNKKIFYLHSYRKAEGKGPLGRGRRGL